MIKQYVINTCFGCCKTDSFSSPGSHWGDDNWRCKPCSDKRSEKFRKEREALNAKATCEDCGVLTGDYLAFVCEECCDHSDTDHHCCLICGMDMMETFVCQAESMAEGDR